jgi:hypothetical protein
MLSFDYHYCTMQRRACGDGNGRSRDLSRVGARPEVTNIRTLRVKFCRPGQRTDSMTQDQLLTGPVISPRRVKTTYFIFWNGTWRFGLDPFRCGFRARRDMKPKRLRLAHSGSVRCLTLLLKVPWITFL